MSFITLILIKNKQLQTITAHYTIIKKIIEYNDFNLETIKNTTPTHIDAGYILIDCDTKTIVNSQDSIHLNNLLKKFERITL